MTATVSRGIAPSVEQAVRYLLERLSRKQAIIYAVGRLEGPSLRGEVFWKNVLDILEMGKPRK